MDGDREEKLAKSDVLELVMNQKDAQIRYFDTCKEAAVNAALAFLDQRVNLIEEKLREEDQVSFSEFFVDVLIALALGPVAGAAVSALTERAFRTTIRSRQAFLVKEKRKLKFTVREDGVEKVIKAKVSIKREMLFDEQSADHNWWKISTEAVSDAIREVASDELRGREEFIRIQADARKTAGFGEDPGGLVTTIEDYFESQKKTSNSIFNFLLAKLMSDDISEPAVRSIHTVLKILFFDLSEESWRWLKRRYILHYEACMWVAYLKASSNLASLVPRKKILNVDDGRNRRRAIKKIITIQQEKDNLKLEYTPKGVRIDYDDFVIHKPKLTRYMVKRFLDPGSKIEGLTFAQSFVLEMLGGGHEPGLLDRVGVDLYKFLDKKSKERLARKLVSYLEVIEKDMQSGFQYLTIK